MNTLNSVSKKSGAKHTVLQIPDRCRAADYPLGI